MAGLDLVHGLRISANPRAALTGAGGKTTALFQIARQLPPPVWVTTSTHLGIDQLRLADQKILYPPSNTEIDAARRPAGGVSVFTSQEDNDRAAGLGLEELLNLKKLADQYSIPLLVEADGSRTLPLKAPAEHEPVVPAWVDLVIVTAGLSGLGKPLSDEWVHRPQLFTRLSGLQPGETITEDALARVLAHPEGGLKGLPAGVRRVVLLNQADAAPDIHAVHALAASLLVSYDAVLITSLQNPGTAVEGGVMAVLEPYAGILLAAGESKRLRRPKQLLDWRGEPLVRRVAKTALAGGCSPLLVITGAYAAEVEGCLNDLPVRIVFNPDWQEGQASSIRKGVTELPRQAASAFFFLTDQPQVPPDLVRRMAEAHTRSLSPVIAPQVGKQRTNPVLFDRVTFPDLLNLSGDMGGRAIFDRFPVEYLDWDDPSLLLDVDTPEDYLKLLDIE